MLKNPKALSTRPGTMVSDNLKRYNGQPARNERTYNYPSKIFRDYTPRSDAPSYAWPIG